MSASIVSFMISRKQQPWSEHDVMLFSVLSHGNVSSQFNPAVNNIFGNMASDFITDTSHIVIKTHIITNDNRLLYTYREIFVESAHQDIDEWKSDLSSKWNWWKMQFYWCDRTGARIYFCTAFYYHVFFSHLFRVHPEFAVIAFHVNNDHKSYVSIWCVEWQG